MIVYKNISSKKKFYCLFFVAYNKCIIIPVRNENNYSIYIDCK